MTHSTYLPSIHNEQPAPTGQSDAAAEFVRLWLAQLPPERQAIMRPDARLYEAAQKQAEYLASRTDDQLLQSMHIGRYGSMPNARVMAVGYKLPYEYSPAKNNVESCARDAGGPQAALDGLLASPAHHDHLMGVNGFRDRVVYGVGHAGDDWVVVICQPEP